MLRDRLLAAASKIGVPRRDAGDIGTFGSMGDRLVGATATRLAAAAVPHCPARSRFVPASLRSFDVRVAGCRDLGRPSTGAAGDVVVARVRPRAGALRGGDRRTRRAGARPRSPPETAHRPAGASPGVARASAPRPPQKPSPHFSPGSRSASRPGVRSARSGPKSASGNTVEARDAAGGRLGATRRAALSGRQCASRRLPDAPHRAARRSYPVGRTEPRRP